MTNVDRIRELNDRFRRTFAGGQVVVTAGVNALSEQLKSIIIDRVRGFDHFTADNDPHKEHDFGSIEIEGQRFFWKIDYLDLEKTFGSPDPADTSVTMRVLTIMLAQEY